MPHSHNAQQTVSYNNLQNGTGIKNSGGNWGCGCCLACFGGKSGSSIYWIVFTIDKFNFYRQYIT